MHRRVRTLRQVRHQIELELRVDHARQPHLIVDVRQHDVDDLGAGARHRVQGGAVDAAHLLVVRQRAEHLLDGADPDAFQRIELERIAVTLRHVTGARRGRFVGWIDADGDVEHGGEIRHATRERPADILRV